MKIQTILIGLMVVLSLGCSSSPKAAPAANPAENPGDAAEAKTEATYFIPAPAQPEGQVRILSEGVVTLQQTDTNDSLPALKIHMTVTNLKGQEPWTVDARQQLLALKGRGNFRSAFVHAPGESLPLIRIPTGSTKEIDLFYPLPEEFKGITEIPPFTLNWSVTAGTHLISESTPFTRIAANTAPPRSNVYPFGSGSSTEFRPPRSSFDVNLIESAWWMDPFADLPVTWQQAFR